MTRGRDRDGSSPAWRRRGGSTQALRRWGADHAIPFDPLDPDADPETLAPLDERLEGKRVVFLGESDHFVHEKYGYRLLFLRYLHSRGWRHAGEELAWSDGLRVDRYLATGDPTHLERVSAYGYRGGERTDRDDRPTGVLAEFWESHPEASFRAEQVRFARALRELVPRGCEAERLRFFGFDVDYHPWIGYEELDRCLHPGTDEPSISAIQQLLVRVPGETLDQEIERIGRAVDRIESGRRALEARLGATACAELVRCARTLRDSHAYVRLAHPAPSWARLREAMAARERLMHQHVDHVLSRIGPEGKVVLMGHDLHLAKDDDRIDTSRIGAGPGGGRVPSLGTHLCRRLAPQVFSVWMLDGREVASGTLRSLGRRLPRAPRTLNAILSELGSAFVLPTGASEGPAPGLSAPREVASIRGSRFRAAVAEQADVICFVRETTPLRG